MKTRPRVLPARLRNDAGIVGAALYAMDQVNSHSVWSQNGVAGGVADPASAGAT
jgi:hypothetical protein